MESGSYYLRARYYDPSIGRFTQEDPHWSPSNMIYGDEPQQIGEYEDPLGTSRYVYAPQITAVMQAGNLYGYCLENPNTYVDSNGEWVHIVIGAFIGGLVSFVGSVASQKATSGKIDWVKVAISAGAGAVSGGLAATGVGLLGQIASNAIIGASANLAEQLYLGNGDITKVNITDVMINAAIGATSGLVSGKGSGTPHLDTASKQLIKRCGNAFKCFSGSTLKKELKNAVKNYFKNTGNTEITNLMRSIFRSLEIILAADIIEYIDSLFESYLYEQSGGAVK